MKIFISYRRDDSAGYAGRLYDLLAARFGAKNVFMDIDTIPPGKDFRKVITDEVGKCDVVLVLIGKQWLGIVDAQGHRRLDDPQDWVRVEIATALAKPGVWVIPVLVHNARMPGAHELPEELKELVWRNAIELSDSRFQHDTKKLIQAIEAAEAEKRGIPFVKRRRKPERRFPWLAAILIAVLGILGLALIYFPSIRQQLWPELTHTPIAAIGTVEPTHTSVTITNTASQTAVVTEGPVIQILTPPPTENTRQPLPPPTSVSSVVVAEPTSIAPTTTNTASPVPTILAAITDCLALDPDAPYPTPIAQQTPRPSDDYLFYDSSFETPKPMATEVKDYAEYYLYWKVTDSFKDRLKLSPYTALHFIALDNRQPVEGNYSICIEAPPQTYAPAEYRHLTQPLPAEAETTLRLSFFYRTFGNPDFIVQLTASGDYNGPFYNVPEPLGLSESWTKKDIDFKVNADPNCRNPPFENAFPGRPVGCFNLRFLVGGTGIVWIDYIRVDEVS